jgi:opacity protein-like surface antigen
MYKMLTIKNLLLKKIVAGIFIYASLLILTTQAANVSGAWSKETLLEQASLKRLSIGVNYEQIVRPVSMENVDNKPTLKARHTSGYLGIDLTRWFTLFGTAGAIEAKEKEESDYENFDVAWGAGAYLNLWQYNVQDPNFLAGRLSFRLLGEFSQNRSSDKTEWKWNEIYSAFLVGYEIFTTSPAATQKYPYSLLLYGGPALSFLDGHYKKNGVKNDFDEEQSIGIVGGVDLFISHNLSAGGYIQYYDDATFGASVRYHF